MAAPVIAFLWPEQDFEATGLERPPGYAMRFGHAGDRSAAEAACTGADYIVVASGFGRVDQALLDLAPAAKLVQLTGAGYDNVDREACRKRGLPVCHVPGLNAPSVAQLAVQMAFRLARPLPLLAEGGDEAWRAARARNVTARELGGRVGVIGYGPIGRKVAALFRGLGLTVHRLAYKDQDDPDVPASDLNEILAESDILVVCLPFRESTRGMIGAAQLALMKPTCRLINVGRGGVVDDWAAAEALENDRLGGIGFDVFGTEPTPADHPFFRLREKHAEKILLTPHIGGQTLDSKRRNFRIALDNIERVAKGVAPIYPVPEER